MIGCDCEVCLSPDPMDRRLRSSVMIESEGMRIVIDTGPDFRYQMLRTGIRQLDAILFTHPHKDHIAGLDDVRAFNFFSGRAMPLYANELTEEALRREYHYAFAKARYPGVPELDINRIDTEPFRIGSLTIIPILVWHLKMPVLGFRIGDFTYITDAKTISEQEINKVKGTKTLIINALHRNSHVSHFNLEEALRVIEEINPEKAYLTHISHLFGKQDDIQKELPKNIFVAYDGLKLPFAY